MNENTPIQPKTLIRYHLLIILLIVPMLIHIIIFQGPAAQLAAVEIPVSLLIGPAASDHQPAPEVSNQSEVSNQPDASSAIEHSIDSNFEYTEEVAFGYTAFTPEYESIRISEIVASFEQVPQAPLDSFQKEAVSTPRKQEPEDRFDPIIMQAAHRYKVDPNIIKAIIKAESGYNPKAVSHRGAKGLMQLMPKTAKSLGVKDIFCPKQNIHGGVKYFKQLLNQFKGNTKLALAAYNAGSRKVRKYRGIPPFKTTRLYIKKVIKYHKEYQQEIVENS